MAMSSMTDRIIDAAKSIKLLVVSDFDGTIAGFADDPTQVPINERTMHALEELALLPNTFVAILSGRDLENLTSLVELNAPIMLVGSHGAESSSSPVTLSDEQVAVLQRCTAALEAVAEDFPGSYVEHKPFHRVFHVRRMNNPDQRNVALARAREALAGEDVIVKVGKNILELAMLDITKGTWIDAVREQLNCDCVVFAGDDVTDEDGFRALGDYDLGVKVGPGQTAAHLSIDDDLEAVAEMFTALYEARRDYK
ncbi:trehalose-phosphatase [Corynebacterium ciconiae]|uniref:trehalose-phosphatase n=1 Tax=Corynebacterium ciconiae TaxID=227319 RepID=UPI000A03CFD7|nr:trehalose-phosphatase [Corynebacterium ciconiae]